MSQTAGNLREEKAEHPLVSVIMPVFNAEAWLKRSLDSIFAQTMTDFEVIVVDDGSTDRSPELLRDYAGEHPEMRVLTQANAGQGAARNRALDLARGEYVLFVDADDTIEAVTLQVTTERANQDGSDLVHFDWKLLARDSSAGVRYEYLGDDPFWHRRLLQGDACDELLRVANQFSVCKLYRRSFLDEFSIRFDEGRKYYEDNPFVVQTTNRARAVSLLHSPLYTVNPHQQSTTRSRPTDDRMFRDHIFAVQRSFALLDRRRPRAAAYLAAFHVKKFGNYYRDRTPRRFRRAYVREFVDVLHAQRFDGAAAKFELNAPSRLALKLRVFERRRYALFQTMIVAKNLIMPVVKGVRNAVRAIKRGIDPRSPWHLLLERALKQPIRANTISFLGLDSRYTGNSRYLFEQLLEDPRFAQYDVRFVTDDSVVPAARRLDPGSLRTNMHLARSELLIAESWIPAQVRKNPASTWVQLWHGTPIKRMLFDSHEAEITSGRPHHKAAKFKDIQQWDYLVVDSEAAADKFATAFLFDRSRMLHSGYPRVKHLLEHRDGAAAKASVCAQLGVEPAQRRVLLYAPTWRDYNYGRSASEADHGYLLDIGALASALGDEWLVLFHDHGFMSSTLRADAQNCVDASAIEIQDLILAADVVVSDYSSVIFDAFAVERRVLIYANDRQLFEQSRGVYEDVWRELEPLVVENVDELWQKLLRDPDGVLMREVERKYCFDSSIDLGNFLAACPDRSSW